jgi:L-ascorbate metabolism protein UlaG (beta-lactamase superfamily)
MNTEPRELYLRPEVKLEPLVCRWPAWPHLVAPATQAMNIAFRYLPNLRSFASNPNVHAAAAADPSMLGGPFVNLGLQDVPAVQSLIQSTLARCSHSLAFASDFRALSTKLEASAKGFSLTEFSRKLPDSLAGMVELVYDGASHPRIKVIEELLYKRGLANVECQELCLHDSPDNGRPFFMSTPQLDDPERVFLRVPFSDPVLDEISLARIRPISERQLLDCASSASDNAKRLRSFFTDSPPIRKFPAYADSGVRVRVFGHACVLIQTSEVAILIDPSTPLERDQGEASLTFSDLPDYIDYVVLTHCHQDHVIPEVLMQLRRRIGAVIVPPNQAGNLADPSMKLILRHLGFQDIEVIDPFESIHIPDGEIMSLPFAGEHADLDINSKHCVLIRIANRSFLFLVDSDSSDPALIKYIAEQTGSVDALFVGMECNGAPLNWLYGPLLTKPTVKRDDNSRRLSASDSDRAWTAVKSFGCSAVYVYAMGQEAWLRHWLGLAYTPQSIQIVESEAFLTRCRGAGIAAQRLQGCHEMIFNR